VSVDPLGRVLKVEMTVSSRVVLHRECSQLDSVLLLIKNSPESREVNATLQARPMVGARHERRLLGVACKRLFGVLAME